MKRALSNARYYKPKQLTIMITDPKTSFSLEILGITGEFHINKDTLNINVNIYICGKIVDNFSTTNPLEAVTKFEEIALELVKKHKENNKELYTLSSQLERLINEKS